TRRELDVFVSFFVALVFVVSFVPSRLARVSAASHRTLPSAISVRRSAFGVRSSEVHAASANSRGRMRSPRLCTALHFALLGIDHHSRSVAVADFPLPANLREAVAAGGEVVEDRAGEA